jgi:glycosyltransferase involved in cell wall biosynthesis
MKVFLPFQVKDIGGTSTFARKFKEGLEAAGHEVTYDYTEDYDVLFLIVQCPFKYLLNAKRRGKKIVQRLDGTYYWSVAGWRFPLLNAKATYIRHFFADLTIYQSDYSRDCANRFLGRKRRDHHILIYNGVDVTIFTPEGPKEKLKDNPKQTIFFTASAFRRADQIRPLIAGLTRYRQYYDSNIKFVVAGTFAGEVKDIPAELAQFEWIQLLGKIGNKELPRYERAADVFVFTHLNPPCPNNVIESLACGLPVCGIRDGAMPEIVISGKQGELLAVSGSGFWRKRDFDAERFAENLHKITRNRQKYSAASRSAAEERFSLSQMSHLYIRGLEAVVDDRGA